MSNPYANSENIFSTDILKSYVKRFCSMLVGNGGYSAETIEHLKECKRQVEEELERRGGIK